jgi:hypothetical protein
MGAFGFRKSKLLRSNKFLNTYSDFESSDD